MQVTAPELYINKSNNTSFFFFLHIASRYTSSTRNMMEGSRNDVYFFVYNSGDEIIMRRRRKKFVRWVITLRPSQPVCAVHAPVTWWKSYIRRRRKRRSSSLINQKKLFCGTISYSSSFITSALKQNSRRLSRRLRHYSNGRTGCQQRTFRHKWQCSRHKRRRLFADIRD